MRRKGRHHMDRRLGVLLPAGAAQRLAVDSDHLPGCAGQRRHPIDEAALELLGVEHGQNVAEVIMRRRPMAKRPEPPQQLDLLFPKPRNVDECLRPRQHRQQAQQQHFGQRIDHLAGLARVRGHHQGNRVKESCGEEACEEVVVPGGGFAPKAE